jgi:opacity protein-like surface antigen
MFALVLVALAAPAAASAQIRQVRTSSSEGQQAVNFSVGYFALKGLESRVSDDVLLNNLHSAQPLLFEVKDLNGVPVGGEYTFGISPHDEIAIGLGFAQRTVHSTYAHLTHSNNDEIAQDLKLRTVPVTITARFLILPRGSSVEPYVGAGIVAIRYNYSEVGEFVDANDLSIFPARYVAKGTAVGPTVLGGIRAPVSNWTVGVEVRWQKAEGTKLLREGFLGDKIDLGGWTTNVTFGVRF